MSSTEIGTLLVRGEDTPSFRVSLSSMLKSADLRPGGVPPSAILIVRNMEDPLPGRIIPRSMIVDADWERAVRDALSNEYRRAERPVAGYIPSNASAVLFSDEGEMLACLALDMSRGEASQRWWWKMVLQPIHYRAGLKDLLCNRATYLPAAIHYLVEWGHAGIVANSLYTEEIKAVVSAMGREYGITDLGAKFYEAIYGDKPKQKEIEGQRKSVLHAQYGKAIWEKCLPSNFDSLEKEKRYFLGMGLTLYKNPAIVRTNGGKVLSGYVDIPFADRKHTKEEKAESQLFEPGSTGERSYDEVTETSSDASSTELTEKKATKKEVTSQNISPHELLPFDGSSTTVESKPQDKTLFADIYDASLFTAHSEAAGKIIKDTGIQKEEAPFTNKPALQEIEDTPAEFEGRKTPGQSSFKEEKVSSGEDRPLSLSTIQESSNYTGIEEKTCFANIEPTKSLQNLHNVPNFEEKTGEQQKELILENGVDTQLGGVLYLINLMKKLDLPDCFDEEFNLASSLGSWGVLEVIARALLVKYENLEEDPLWDALAKLSGRDTGKLPGEDFQGGDTFHLPPDWLKYVKEDSEYHWASTHARLRVWTKEYLLVDCLKNGSEPGIQANEEFMKYGNSIELSPGSFYDAPLDDIRGSLVEGLNPALKRWLSMVMPFFRSWLRNALGDENESDILHCQGRLFITSTHVDLIINMEKISMRVRQAGLDQDPGWVADFGRVVLFHFE